MQRRLVVAIDYGTSNSGAAYALLGDDDDGDTSKSDVDVEVIKDWPNAAASRDASDKVPSDIGYDKYGRPSGYGFDVSKDAESLQWVKLLLEPDAIPRVSNSPSVVKVWKAYDFLGSAQGATVDKRPVEVVADYLRWLWERIRASIIRKEAIDDSEARNLFSAPKLNVVLTVPASWSERAKNHIQEAAIKAGIPEQSIRLLSEPEAAAIFGLKRQAKKKAFVRGDCIIVCDNGGGTVDVVVYRVRSLIPLSLDQVTESKGSFCGSVCIDAEFQNQLRSELGESFSRLSSETRVAIEQEFEYTIKRSYDLGNERTYFIPVGGLKDSDKLRIRNGKMQVDNSMLNQAFDSIITPIMTLIDEQVAKVHEKGLENRLRGILLVGGLSQSPYLYNRVRQEFPTDNDLKVWLPDNSWTAVAQGAVLCETSGAIHSRLSPYNYGVPYSDGKRRRVRWLVRKGQKVESSMSTEPYGLRIDNQPWLDEDKHCRIIVTLVRSDEENATDDYNEHVTPHAEIDCRVPTSLRHDSSAELIQIFPHKAWHVPAQLVIYLDGAIISFRCKIKDEEVGVADVSYFTDRDSDNSTQSDTASGLTSSPTSPTHARQRSDGSLSEMVLLPFWAINEATAAAYGRRKFESLSHPIHSVRRSKAAPLFNQAHTIGVRTGRDKPRDADYPELPGRYGKARKWKATASGSRRSSLSAVPRSPGVDKD